MSGNKEAPSDPNIRSGDLNNNALIEFKKLIQAEDTLPSKWKVVMNQLIAEGIPADISLLIQFVEGGELGDAATEKIESEELPGNC